ncbi:hypothetical protein VFPPC_15491 [Pochonia chlamydosporia 170]|uniref:Uncharacterized protein n=1 Tax=Pochonia chlamydosporia 170 TaxID=1380566 RepID=A0A179FW35_METCM|nr:hypothetical protein VFPPC_15491 [Pochonia chlamydosporia 170]OAQ69824.1 hypothetical protein VFPPC_15491 [Pochonia chlamydosporia 170]
MRRKPFQQKIRRNLEKDIWDEEYGQGNIWLLACQAEFLRHTHSQRISNVERLQRRSRTALVTHASQSFTSAQLPLCVTGCQTQTPPPLKAQQAHTLIHLVWAATGHGHTISSRGNAPFLLCDGAIHAGGATQVAQLFAEYNGEEPQQ